MAVTISFAENIVFTSSICVNCVGTLLLIGHGAEGVSFFGFRELGVCKFPAFSENTICYVCCRKEGQLG